MIECDFCGARFDPIATRWRCVTCSGKANCCDGAPLPVTADKDLLARRALGRWRGSEELVEELEQLGHGVFVARLRTHSPSGTDGGHENLLGDGHEAARWRS